MNRNRNKTQFRLQTFFAAALLALGMAWALPSSALAFSPAEGALILNVVSVHYEDNTGGGHDANASSLVTVSLVPAGLTVSGPPATGVPGDTGLKTCPPTINSGDTSTTINAVSANANGNDTYTLAIANVVPTNANNQSVTYTVRNYAGVITPAVAGEYPLGSSLTVGVASADTLQFDGGVNLTAMFSIGDIVVVKISGSPIDYRVIGVTNGTAVSHDNPGNVDHSDVGNTNNANAYGTLQLAAFQVTIGGNIYGSNTTPAFTTPATAPPAGTIVGEMALVEVSVSADATSQSISGSVAFDFTTTNSVPNATSDSCSVTVNALANLTIKKEVRNLTAAGSFAATATGKPTDVLEYRVTVTNANPSAANVVVVSDNVPVYTTLVTASGNFATAALNGGTAVNLTSVATDTESATVASGSAGGTAAGSALNFYLGAGNSGGATPAGGTLAGSDEVVLLYQVTID